MSTYLTPFTNSFDKFLDNFNNKNFGFPEWNDEYELYEEGGDLVMKMKVPGFTKENVNIDYDRGVLTVSGNSDEKEESEKGKTYYKKMSSRSFSKSMQLPVRVDEDKFSAKLIDGILTIQMPKTDEKQGTRINID